MHWLYSRCACIASARSFRAPRDMTSHYCRLPPAPNALTVEGCYVSAADSEFQTFSHQRVLWLNLCSRPFQHCGLHRSVAALWQPSTNELSTTTYYTTERSGQEHHNVKANKLVPGQPNSRERALSSSDSSGLLDDMTLVLVRPALPQKGCSCILLGGGGIPFSSPVCYICASI
jgi:hypothetical protein